LLHNTGKYEIVALSNSSVEAAEASIKKFDLPKTVKAYGSATDLANDPDVDLVVCSVRVDKHHSTLLPAIEAGKDVYCEWPLGADPQQAKELLQKAEEKGVRTMVGLQGRMNPRISKIKELIAQGRIGKVLSVAVLTASGLDGGEAYPPAIRYVGEKKVGGNAGTVVFAHGKSFSLH
jgi:predicted dehydrogenase